RLCERLIGRPRHDLVGATHWVALSFPMTNKFFNRRPIRKPGYDYSDVGAYFLTLCAKDMACIFGSKSDDRIELSKIGKIVDVCWREISTHYKHAELGAWNYFYQGT